MTLECHVLPTITVLITQREVEANKILIQKNMQLADPAYKKPGKIDILIGAGPYWKILVGSPRNKIEGQPALQNTRLGWIIGGELCSARCNSRNQASTCLAITNDQLQQQLEQFWRVENLSQIKHSTAEKKACERYFAETMHQEEDGRFVVRLPTRPNVKLGESKKQTVRRLEALEQRFQRNPELREAYCNFIEEYVDRGHMTQISEKKLLQAQEFYFISHQAVIRPDSLTTKLRVVFDASAKTSTG
ncbi:uncharacterized protein LOC109859972 [Pseudomyrmex gracilis]|uniref:uncharacterized protein LOC109859972 n=1 Tax=Pseudomyrmex gracilis TaxID=219809 RepID=UPI000995226F|nr:uncharacterized protein LOC109859972 [Pseudomyrmex gracilis]